jgi:hypothetical protein
MMIISVTVNQQIDTSLVCVRNSIADITFYDSGNIITKIVPGSPNPFPYKFIEKTRQMRSDAKASLTHYLNPGKDLPAKFLHDDWIILIILTTAFLFLLIRTATKSMFPGVIRFFFFRGINDPSSRDIGVLFHWQSTILNLIAFLIVSLFTFCSASFYNAIPFNLSGILFWIFSIIIIISAVTLRHIVCIITGTVSGEQEVFREYLLGVYQFYKFSALFLFVIIIIISYTFILPPKEGILLGLYILVLMYLIRVTRLLIIFINRNISIFYLILYLCALEILPVLISVKYFSGLV